jgi:hypothetical protein
MASLKILSTEPKRKLTFQWNNNIVAKLLDELKENSFLEKFTPIIKELNNQEKKSLMSFVVNAASCYLVNFDLVRSLRHQ